MVKKYAVYYDGTASERACGLAELGGKFAVIYMRGGQGYNCGRLAESVNPGVGFLDAAMLHELFHVLGVVPRCAPHEDGTGHVSDGKPRVQIPGLSLSGEGQGFDLMGGGREIDVGGDDYYNPDASKLRKGCINIAGSPYFKKSTPLYVQQN